uniref:Uncharacterized protein n=1 Tax=Anopheles farauti TaxID=69004 RepID=A0A182QDR0_9DIPT
MKELTFHWTGSSALLSGWSGSPGTGAPSPAGHIQDTAKMAVQRTYRWQLVAALSAVLLVAVSISECSASTSLVASSRLRRVHKSTYTEATSTAEQAAPQMQRAQKSQLLEPAPRSTTAKKLVSTKTKPTVASFTTTLRERVDQAVQKVRARSKEIKMEQEQKRVDRKLRRDQQKQSRDPVAPVEPINPHNLKMPDCPAGKVYNGRRCVAMGKTPKH